MKRVREGPVFSKEPGNLRNLHSYKYSGLVNAKTIHVHDTPTGVQIVTKKQQKKKGEALSANAVGGSQAKQSIRARSGGRRALGVASQYSKRGYRPDLRTVSALYLDFIPLFLVLVCWLFGNALFVRTHWKKYIWRLGVDTFATLIPHLSWRTINTLVRWSPCRYRTPLCWRLDRLIGDDTATPLFSFSLFYDWYWHIKRHCWHGYQLSYRLKRKRKQDLLKSLGVRKQRQLPKPNRRNRFIHFLYVEYECYLSLPEIYGKLINEDSNSGLKNMDTYHHRSSWVEDQSWDIPRIATSDTLVLMNAIPFQLNI